MRLSRRGSALVLSLFMVLLFSVLATTVFSIIRSQVRESVYQLRGAQAEVIAETGLDEALYQLRVSTAWRTGFTDKPFAGGSYTVYLSTDVWPWVVSTGRSRPIALMGPTLKSVRARARITAAPAVRVEIEPDSWEAGPFRVAGQ